MRIASHLIKCDKCKESLKFKKEVYVVLDKTFKEEKQYIEYKCARCGNIVHRKEISMV